MYWEPAKYVARLRATKTDGNSLLLKTNMGRHGGASGSLDRLRDAAFDRPQELYLFPGCPAGFPGSEITRSYAQSYPCFESGSERMRSPVAVKIALQTAGRIGGSAGSPRPVGGLSVFRK